MVSCPPKIRWQISNQICKGVYKCCDAVVDVASSSDDDDDDDDDSEVPSDGSDVQAFPKHICVGQRLAAPPACNSSTVS